jgi:hypothetical protein
MYPTSFSRSRCEAGVEQTASATPVLSAADRALIAERSVSLTFFRGSPLFEPYYSVSTYECSCSTVQEQEAVLALQNPSGTVRHANVIHTIPSIWVTQTRSGDLSAWWNLRANSTAYP